MTERLFVRMLNKDAARHDASVESGVVRGESTLELNHTVWAATNAYRPTNINLFKSFPTHYINLLFFDSGRSRTDRKLGVSKEGHFHFMVRVLSYCTKTLPLIFVLLN